MKSRIGTNQLELTNRFKRRTGLGAGKGKQQQTQATSSAAPSRPTEKSRQQGPAAKMTSTLTCPTSATEPVPVQTQIRLKVICLRSKIIEQNSQWVHISTRPRVNPKMISPYTTAKLCFPLGSNPDTSALPLPGDQGKEITLQHRILCAKCLAIWQEMHPFTICVSKSVHISASIPHLQQEKYHRHCCDASFIKCLESALRTSKTRLLYGVRKQSKRCLQGNLCNVDIFAFKNHVIMTGKKKHHHLLS